MPPSTPPTEPPAMPPGHAADHADAGRRRRKLVFFDLRDLFRNRLRRHQLAGIELPRDDLDLLWAAAAAEAAEAAAAAAAPPGNFAAWPPAARRSRSSAESRRRRSADNWIKDEIKTVQALLVFPVCTNVCSNMRHFLSCTQAPPVHGSQTSSGRLKFTSTLPTSPPWPHSYAVRPAWGRAATGAVLAPRRSA